jgi:hypothetical protein
LLEQARKTWHCTKLQGLISHGPCRLDGATEIGLRHFRLTQLETPFPAARQRVWAPELLLRVRGERFVEVRSASSASSALRRPQNQDTQARSRVRHMRLGSFFDAIVNVVDKATKSGGETAELTVEVTEQQ